MILISQAIFDTQMKTTFAGYLQIQDDKIVAIGPLSALPVDEEVIDYGEQMIIPSFIDCHVHFFLSALLESGKITHLQGDSEEMFAQQVVDFLKGHPAVKEVLYTGKAGMISFKVVDESKIPTIINRLSVFTFAESLGGVESLITYPSTQTHLDIPADIRQSYGLTDDLLRISIGIEDAEDLIADLKEALEA